MRVNWSECNRRLEGKGSVREVTECWGREARKGGSRMGCVPPPGSALLIFTPVGLRLKELNLSHFTLIFIDGS